MAKASVNAPVHSRSVRWLQQVHSLALLTGSSDIVEPFDSLMAIGQHFDLDPVSKYAARFVYAVVEARLNESGISRTLAEPFWLAVRATLGKV